MAKYKAHTQYKLADGSTVVGTSTVTKQLGWNTQVLIRWANKLGLDGIDSTKFVDDKAAIGTLAHALITDRLKKKETDLKDYTENQVKEAKNCVLSYDEWEKGKKVEPILVEEILTSEEHKYGGTPDFYGKVNGKYELIDYKTGKGIYLEYYIQVVGAYKRLLEEKGHKIDTVRILNIPRTQGDSFQQAVITRDTKVFGRSIFDICDTIFLNALENYNLHSMLVNGFK
jgi:hypothetical protein